MTEFQDKVVIVTGGANGIGNGICQAFAQEGARVICADIDQAAGAALVAASAELPGEIRFKPADVTTSSDCQALVEAAVAWGGVNVLCNNVGIQPVTSYVRAHELPEEMWDRILDVNLKSAFLMTKYCVPEMQKQGGGVIINTASVQGLQSMNNVSAYAASKGGILSLTQNLALDYAQDNIRVLAVNPGTIDTPMVAQAIEASGLEPDEVKAGWAKVHPIGRVGQPKEIANVIVFLASEKASYITGEYICVDGGLMAKGAWA